MGHLSLYTIVKVKERMIKMTNLQTKPQINNKNFKVIEGGKNRKKPLERLLGVALLVASGLVLLLDGDATALVFISFFALPMIFGKKSVIIK